MVNSFDLLGVNVSRTTPDKAVCLIFDWIQALKRVYVCVAPVSTIMSCQDDSTYKEIVNRAAMVTPDGMPLVWLAHLKGCKDVIRTHGSALMGRICCDGQERKIKHFFYGATDAVLMKLAAVLKEKYPDINIVGSVAPGFLKVGEKESTEIIERINASGADILWVGIGSPKQDYWMANHRNDLNVPVMVGVGAAFDFLSGLKPIAPRWVQYCGLEWFFRFCCEPKRLWRRYLIGNTKFIYLLLKEFLLRKNDKN